MDETAIYLDTAQQHGYPQQSAHRALDQVVAWLHERQPLRLQHPDQLAFYIFRSGSQAADPGEPAEPEVSPARPRILLAFTSADAALGFAQQATVAVSPRLLRLSLPRLLAALIQRPAITALIFVDDIDERRTGAGLPDGLRLDRGVLLELLK
jgi:hypothetical protein